MKYLLLTILSVSFLTNVALGDGILKKIGLAIEAGNAKAVATYFRGDVTLNILKQKGTYKAPIAEDKLRKFFQANPPKQFITLHQGSSNANSKYLKLKTKGNDYRTYLLLKEGSKNQQPEIRELEFE